MGGSGGGFTPKDKSVLTQRFKKRMPESTETGRKNCFISFDYDADGREVNLLRAQAKNENSDVTFNDHSVKEPYNSKNAEYIKRQIREKLRHCSTTIVYCTEQSAKNSWVNWEVEASLEMGKKVICMYQGTRPKNLPPAAEKAGVRVIPWNAKEINRAIGK